MSTHDWMRAEPAAPADRGPKARAASHERSILEYVLATTGFAAWIWCAYEVAKALIR